MPVFIRRRVPWPIAALPFTRLRTLELATANLQSLVSVRANWRAANKPPSVGQQLVAACHRRMPASPALNCLPRDTLVYGGEPHEEVYRGGEGRGFCEV